MVAFFLPAVMLAGASCGLMDERSRDEPDKPPVISSSSDVEKAVVRIQDPRTSDAEMDPRTAEQATSSGSGYIIDPSGIAIEEYQGMLGTWSFEKYGNSTYSSGDATLAIISRQWVVDGEFVPNHPIVIGEI